jgi:malonyl-CoA O-methyltransferase
VATRFAAAAATYDAHSDVQRHAAQRLAEHIAVAGLPPQAQVLEIGCGTGHLTEQLVSRLPGAHIVATDIAPAMVAACRERLIRFPGVTYAVMDGMHPALAGPADLICANLAAQWFDDLPGTIEELGKLLAPGGILALSLLGEGSFHEWRTACARHGLRPGTLTFPAARQLAAAFPAGGNIDLVQETWLDHPASGLDFLRALRAIGADTPLPGHKPLSVPNLRKVLHELGPAPAITYELLYACWQSAPAAAIKAS